MGVISAVVLPNDIDVIDMILEGVNTPVGAVVGLFRDFLLAQCDCHGVEFYGFGSYFNGRWTDGLDIDFMIIGPYPERLASEAHGVFKVAYGLDFHVNIYPNLDVGLLAIPKRHPDDRLFMLYPRRGEVLEY